VPLANSWPPTSIAATSLRGEKLRLTAVSKASRRKGFRRNSALKRRASSGRGDPLMNRMGNSGRMPRSRAAHSRPSAERKGRSIIARENASGSASKRAIALGPLGTWQGAWPFASNSLAMISRISGKSSTIRTPGHVTRRRNMGYSVLSIVMCRPQRRLRHAASFHLHYRFARQAKTAEERDCSAVLRMVFLSSH
jgi:hypothetical protein